MKIPFSPPFITDEVFEQVKEVLESGWITTGPKVAALEREITKYTSSQASVAVNSWSSGATLMMKWLGIKPGDEVIIPAYTYAATALSVLHAGGRPVMADVDESFCISHRELDRLITSKTKAIIPVDFGGMPADYDIIKEVLVARRSNYRASSPVQESIGRIAMISDAAHSFGAVYKGVSSALASDITIYSTHAVKNLTTAEGGVIVLNLPGTFDVSREYRWLILNRLNGQTKDAFAKTKAGGWQYDIVSPGMKINMPDICAAIALGQLPVYEQTLVRRREIFDLYNEALRSSDYILPRRNIEYRDSSCHLYPLRLSDGLVGKRDEIIEYAAKDNVALNVHFRPLPELSLFAEMGYSLKEYPNTVRLSRSEISLPIFPQMSNEMAERVVEVVLRATREV